LQKLDDAVASFKQSTTLTPDSPEAWRNLGQAYVALHKPFDAAQAFQKADQLSEKVQTHPN
jgi:cytochrome c-type biogenesis protein CcmH/NrfG